MMIIYMSSIASVTTILNSVPAALNSIALDRVNNELYYVHTSNNVGRISVSNVDNPTNVTHSSNSNGNLISLGFACYGIEYYNGYLYAADYGGKRIVRYARGSTTQEVWKQDTTNIPSPCQFCFDDRGYMYIANYSPALLSVFDQNGTFLGSRSMEGGFQGVSFYIDTSNNIRYLYLSCYNSNRLFRMILPSNITSSNLANATRFEITNSSIASGNGGQGCTTNSVGRVFHAITDQNMISTCTLSSTTPSRLIANNTTPSIGNQPFTVIVNNWNELYIPLQSIGTIVRCRFQKPVFSGTFTIPTKTVGDTPFTINNTFSSTNTLGPYAYQSSNTNVATISGNTITIVGAGTSTITATQPAYDLFSASDSITATLTVNSGSSSTPSTTNVSTYLYHITSFSFI